MENPNRTAFSESVNLTWKWEIGALSLRARPVRSDQVSVDGACLGTAKKR